MTELSERVNVWKEDVKSRMTATFQTGWTMPSHSCAFILLPRLNPSSLRKHFVRLF